MRLSIIFVAVVPTTTLSRHRRRRHDRLLQEQQVGNELYDDWSAINKVLSSIELLQPEEDFTNTVCTSPSVK